MLAVGASVYLCVGVVVEIHRRLIRKTSGKQRLVARIASNGYTAQMIARLITSRMKKTNRNIPTGSPNAARIGLLAGSGPPPGAGGTALSAELP